MSGPRSKILVLVLLFVGAWLILAVLTHALWISLHGDNVGYDYYPRWYGAREMLMGHNPYDLSINREILSDMGFPHFIPYKHNFSYPATMTFILLPFWLLDFFTSLSLWGGLQLLSLLLLPGLFFVALMDWRIRPWRLALIVFFSMFIFRHSMVSFVLGQFTVFCFSAVLTAAWLIKKGHFQLAALAMMLATIRPEGVIFAGVLLLDQLLERHYRVIIFFAAMMGVVFLLSVIWIGFWIPDFLDAAEGYQRCCEHTEPSRVLGSDMLALIIVTGVAVWAVWMQWQVRSLADGPRLAWGLTTVLLAYLIIMTQSKNYTLVYGLLPVWTIVWAGQGRWHSLLLASIILASPWSYFVLGHDEEGARKAEQIVTPLILVAGITVYWLKWKSETRSTSPLSRVPKGVLTDG